MNDKLKDLIKEALGVTIWEIVKFILGLIFTVTSSVFASRLLIFFEVFWLSLGQKSGVLQYKI